MDHDDPTQEETDAAATNEQMVQQMKLRRETRPERRLFPSKPVKIERRRSCSYCYQPGDHPSPDHCLRALERPEK
jgi:hypothetical protein